MTSEHDEHPAFHAGYKEGYGHGHKDGTKGKPRKLKTGGEVHEGEPKPYNAIGLGVEKEAEERKKGGKLKRGGVAKEHFVEGGDARPRMDRMPRRARGGRTGGSNSNPLSSAAHSTTAIGRKDVDGDVEPD